MSHSILGLQDVTPEGTWVQGAQGLSAAFLTSTAAVQSP